MQKKIKNLFPFFKHNTDYVYLDNSASTQKPSSVIKAMTDFYEYDYSNIHRGLYKKSEVASNLYDETKQNIANYINAKSKKEIIFTSGTTDGLNLLASCFSKILKFGDEIFLTEAEHHSNLLPWINLKDFFCIKYIPVKEDGSLDYDFLEKNISKKTKIVAMTGMSNVIGFETDIKKITDIAHKYNAIVIVDGAQLLAHKKIDVINDDVDFLCFSAHKIYGPTGIGVLYGKQDLLEMLPPYKFGGDMVKTVGFDKIVLQDIPTKFEAGTPPIAEVIGLNEAINFLNSQQVQIRLKELKQLTVYAINKLKEIGNVKFLSHKDSNSVISFVVDAISSFDIGMMLGAKNICVRVGYHCAEPLHKKMGFDNSIRVSLAVYNDEKDIDIFVKNLKEIINILK